MLQRSKTPKRPEWHYGSDDAVASKQGVLCHSPLPLNSIVIQPPGGQPPLELRRCADHLAAQRARAVSEAVRDRQRRQPVKENHPVRKFSGRHRKGFTAPGAGGYNRDILAGDVSAGWPAPLASGVQARVQRGSQGSRRCGSERVRGDGLARGKCLPNARGKRSPNPGWRRFFRGKRPPGGPEPNRQAIVLWFLFGQKRMLGGVARNFASDRADFLGSHPESRIHPRRLNSS